MRKGFMIVCDGSNGAGKTTIMLAIEDHLKNKGLDVLVTREPGGTPIGEKIREIILCPDTPEMDSVTELMLFIAARNQHVKEKIIPAIESGKIILCDRFDSATISFQHYGRGLPLDLIHQFNNVALSGFNPDINIILDIDPIIGIERINSSGGKLDRMEKGQMEFLERARNGYLAQAKEDPKHFAIVDASRRIEEVIIEVIQIVDRVVLV